MKKEYPLEKMDLALFDNKKQVSGVAEDFSQLKDFISFLKLFGYTKPFKFSHVESNGPLIENLSLEKNLTLHASNNVQDTEEKQLELILEQSGNPHLIKLYNSISLKHSMPAEVDDETRKTVALVKALIQNGDFLFLENPEKFLGKQTLSLFMEALVYKTATTGQIVVINTRFENIWVPHFTKRIYRDEKNLFQVNHFTHGHESTLLRMQDRQDAQDEGVIKIVNKNRDETEENKKAA